MIDIDARVDHFACGVTDTVDDGRRQLAIADAELY